MLPSLVKATSVARKLLAFFCLTAVSLQAANAVSLEMRSEVLLVHPRLMVGDTVSINTNDVNLFKKISDIDLGEAPRVGYVSQVTRAEIDAKIRQKIRDLPEKINWHGPQSARIRTATQQVDKSAILNAAESVLREEFSKIGQVKITPTALIPDIELPVGSFEIRARKSAGIQLQSRIPVWVDLILSGTVYRSVVVPLALEAFERVLVAKSDLKTGDFTNQLFIETQEKNIAELKADFFPANQLQSRFRVLHPVLAGEVLNKRNVSDQTMILRGDRVRLIAIASGINVETSAIAQADATLGQTIRVKPEKSNDTVIARVTTGDTVTFEGQ
jgi:flagellar basal body P-ring formation protein FlgA